jgi:DNA polymerase III alpha subunit (gram-positive type)
VTNKKTTKKKTSKKKTKSALTRIHSLSTKAEIPDLSNLKPSDLNTVIVGNLYVLRLIIEDLGPSKEDVYDMQVAENRIRQASMQLASYFDDDTGGKGGRHKPKRRTRKDT